MTTLPPDDVLELVVAAALDDELAAALDDEFDELDALEDELDDVFVDVFVAPPLPELLFDDPLPDVCPQAVNIPADSSKMANPVTDFVIRIE